MPKLVKPLSFVKSLSKASKAIALLFTAGVLTVGYSLSSSFAAGNASLYVQPSSGTYTSGTTITVEVRVNTGGEDVNAVQADFSYSSSYLQYLSIDASGSAFAIDANSSGGSGNVSIARGNISNVNSASALLAKVKFKALNNSGSATISFKDSSAIVRTSDSTDIMDASTGGNYTIKASSTSSGGSTGGSGSGGGTSSGGTTTKKPTSGSTSGGDSTSSGGSGTSSPDKKTTTKKKNTLPEINETPIDTEAEATPAVNQALLLTGIGSIALALLATIFLVIRHRMSNRTGVYSISGPSAATNQPVVYSEKSYNETTKQ
jgi:hypothetical protein